ncbi:hypothetical protein BUALT_Bualt06G0046500 [Buddleja alternifolia]|uniref:Uncharacterized protein n=1 Tax=Buddleja alternifolia TaxID=168488 RepID=A0AAV6XL46_9LAMI|nr:hypothetical protein BUALT_Bualt06G0046500 [Buddleja alternifolia]
MDRDSFTDDDYLGQATWESNFSIYLKELFQRGVEDGKAELATQKYRVVSSDQTYHGEIQVGLTFTTTGETEKKEN